VTAPLAPTFALLALLGGVPGPQAPAPAAPAPAAPASASASASASAVASGRYASVAAHAATSRNDTVVDQAVSGQPKRPARTASTASASACYTVAAT
jgi:hypothetical protein